MVKAFEYIAPSTVDEALTALAGKGHRARPLAGGTDLIVQMRRGVLDVERVVDVKKIPELNAITYRPGEGLTVGAAVPCHRIVEDADIVRFYPGLVDAVSLIGGTAIKGRATMGGNLCNAAPSGDSIPAMIVLGATCSIAGPSGMRTVPVEQILHGARRDRPGLGTNCLSRSIFRRRQITPGPAICVLSRATRWTSPSWVWEPRWY